MIIGVKRIGNRQQVSSCSGTITATVRLNVALNVTYNQGSGNIVAYIGSNSQSPSAPARVTGHENDQMHIAPLSPTMPGYNLVYNETQAPLNKSVWKIYDNNYNFTNQTLTPASNTVSMVKSQDNWTYEAQMKKLYNITFQNNFINVGHGGTITVNGSSYNSPASGFTIIEQNSIPAAASSYSYNGIVYYFNNWTGGNISNPTASSTTFYLGDHTTYTANFIGYPRVDAINMHYDQQIVGNPIKILWTDNPNSNVTQYQIWRSIKNGQGPTLIATIGRGIQTYTDQDYAFTGTYTDLMLSYDVRQYYLTEGTYSTQNYVSVFGTYNTKMVSKGNIAKSNVESEEINNYGLEQNSPNPFNPSTIINYQIPNNGIVSLKVYDILGREVMTLVNEVKMPGKYSVRFDASNLTSGIYIYQLKTNGFTSIKKMILAK